MPRDPGPWSRNRCWVGGHSSQMSSWVPVLGVGFPTFDVTSGGRYKCLGVNAGRVRQEPQDPQGQALCLISSRLPLLG